MKRRNLGLLLICISVTFSITSLEITGNVIGSTLLQPYSSILVITIFSVGTFLFISGKSLDAIIIPTGAPPAEKTRTERAYDAYKSRGAGFFLISGEVPRDDKGHIKKGVHTQKIYEQLRSYGIKPSQIKIEGRSQDTEENVKYSFKRLERENVSKIGIASSKEHLDRFSNLIAEGKASEDIPRDMKMYRLTTKQGFGEKAYGVAAKIYHAIVPGKPPKIIKKVGNIFFH